MFRIDLKTFWAWLCLTNTSKLSERKCQAVFWGDIFVPNPQALYYMMLLMINETCNSCYAMLILQMMKENMWWNKMNRSKAHHLIVHT